jgi:recombination protein RecA
MADRVKLVKAGQRVDTGGNYFTNPKDKLKFISTGCVLFNLALGGGWAENRITNIVGDKSTGKTLLCIEAAANFHIKYPKGRILYRESESAFDKAYAAALGFPMSAVEFGDEPLETIEDFFEELDALTKRKHNQPVLYICDSLDALSDREELKRDLDAGSYGMQKAKTMSRLFRQLVRALARSNVTVIIVSQIRDKLNAAAFGKKWTRAGGHALDFYASHVVYLAQIGMINKTVSSIRRPVGVTIKAKIDKNKVALPYREADFPLLFGYGIDDMAASLMWLKQIKELKKLRYPANMSEKDIRIEARKASNDDVREVQAYVIKRWYELERSFVPVRRKYGEAA